MPTFEPNDLIINRLQSHIRDAQHYLASQPPAGTQSFGLELYPPLPQEQVREAEAVLGFPLPPLLRDIYTQIGYGDLGLGGSLLRLREQGRYDDMGAVELHSSFQKENRVPAELADILPPWPEQLVPFWAWGCNILSCVDCAEPEGVVYGFDPHLWEHEYLFLLSPSLASWIGAALDGADLWSELMRLSGQARRH